MKAYKYGMQLDPSTCYQAMIGRDRRFEGRFVVAVVTTKIYCRPGCPAPLPRRKNVRFYPTAAAAEEAGFRACLRCRPDALPGTPAWLGTSVTVARALRMLAAGDGEDGGVEALAIRLGIGSRHLRRLFIEHLGASPRAVAQTRRAHFARKLLDETSLPMTEVALASGYLSIRRFNDAIRQTFRMTPTELRKSVPARAKDEAALRLHLPFHPPLDWTTMIGFLAGRATPGVESVTDGVYRRTIEWNGAAGALEVRPAKSSDRSLELSVTIPVTKDLLLLVERVNRMFDLGADSDRIIDALSKDPLLRPILRRSKGLRVPVGWDPFELSVRAILGQQVSVAGATTLAGRLAREFGRPLPGPLGPGLTHLFPLPGALAEADLARIGMPQSRAETIRGLARAVKDGALDLSQMKSLEEIVAALTRIPGVGDWTAQYIAMRGFGEPDAFPASDLGLRKALGTKGELASAREVSERAENWRPWRAYAALALWQSPIDVAPRPARTVTKKERKGK